jgi:hypothetical protein
MLFFKHRSWPGGCTRDREFMLVPGARSVEYAEYYAGIWRLARAGVAAIASLRLEPAERLAVCGPARRRSGADRDCARAVGFGRHAYRPVAIRSAGSGGANRIFRSAIFRSARSAALSAGQWAGGEQRQPANANHNAAYDGKRGFRFDGDGESKRRGEIAPCGRCGRNAIGGRCKYQRQ